MVQQAWSNDDIENVFVSRVFFWNAVATKHDQMISRFQYIKDLKEISLT